MKNLRNTLLLTLLYSTVFTVRADLLNVSTNVLQSQANPAVACTIVGTDGPTWRGLKAIMVMSESMQSGSDPSLSVQDIQSGATITNDDWGGSWVLDGVPQPALSRTTITALLRVPKGTLDALVLASVRPGASICAYSKETKGGSSQALASISLTDVTNNVIRQLPAHVRPDTEDPLENSITLSAVAKALE